jgi:hypothetical protein
MKRVVLAVAVGEHREHEERQPVGDRLVEGREDAGLVHVPGPPLEQVFRLLAPVAAEVGVQQVDHRPEVAPFLDVHLEEVAAVVHGRRAVAQQALLLDAGGLGVPLRDDDAAQRVAELAGNLLPRGIPEEVSEPYPAVVLGRGQEDPPFVVGHLHVVEVRPSLRIDRDGGAEVDLVRLEIRGAGLVPPLEVVGLPLLERPEQALVLRQVDVVRDLLVELHR